MPRGYEIETTYGTSVGSDTATQSDGPSEGEFERFEDLTGKLVQVPKDEIDEQREKA